MKQVVVIAGPSGSGKNAIINGIIARFPHCERLVTATTRLMRPGEADGIDYHFFSQERFDEELAAGNIPEHRFVPSLGTYYGTYIPDVEQRMKDGHIVFAQVDIEGAQFLKERYGATTIFIMPESVEQFRSRLRARNPEWTEREFDTRMRITENELRVHAPQYDYRVVNADGALAETIEKVIEILRKEGYNL
ncbi:guanylate kinase [Candidatus Kaiserbacteria bacterium]|nr:guanylate kinase [Candidatus Kaiserbacteria bacterium]